MTLVFIAHTSSDGECAETLHKELEVNRYQVWRKLQSLDIHSIIYPRSTENMILGSSAVVLLWSQSTAQDEQVGQEILFAQRLEKPLIPIVLDGTALPNTVITAVTLTVQLSCTEVAMQLLPHLPSLQSMNPLNTLWEKAAYIEYTRERKAAVDLAAEMLQRNEQREATLAVLEYLARTDAMIGVREKAQMVLDNDAHKGTAISPPWQSRHFIAVKCPNGHITYFDRRIICTSQGEVMRDKDKLLLTCETEICRKQFLVKVDCEGYQVAIPVKSGERGLYGDPLMSLRHYICLKCKKERQAKFLYSTYDIGPDCVCPFNEKHGKMETYRRV